MAKTNALRQLQSKKVPFTLVEYDYDESNSSATNAAVHGTPVEQVFKTLVAKGNKTGIVIAVIPVEGTLNFKLLAKATGNKKIALIAVKELLPLTGYIRGGCSPVGMKKNYPVYIEQTALEFEKIFVNAGKQGLLMGVDPNHLAKICNGTFANLI